MNKLFEMVLNTSYLTDKLGFYIKFRDLIRLFKTNTEQNIQAQPSFENDMEEMQTNRHVMTKKTLELYTTLMGDVYMYRLRGHEKLQFVDSFEKLEKNIDEELNRIQNRIYFYNVLRYVLAVLVVFWLISVICSNLFSS